MENEPILLLTHNGWGLELVKSVQMIVGEVTNVHEVALQAEDSLGDYLERVTEKIDQLTWHNQLLILTDVKGGTPSNVALRLSKDYDLLIVSGLCIRIRHETKWSWISFTRCRDDSTSSSRQLSNFRNSKIRKYR